MDVWRDTGSGVHVHVHLQSHLVVESADVQGRVPRGVLGSGLSPVEQQVLQVLHVPKAAGLGWREALGVPDRATEPGTSPPLTEAGHPPARSLPT